MLNKRFLNSKCRVTFTLADIELRQARIVYLVGDFNNWDRSATPMRKQGHTFSVSLLLDPNRDYEFCYVTDQGDWHNDDQPDRYARNSFRGFNSIVSTVQTAQAGVG